MMTRAGPFQNVSTILPRLTRLEVRRGFDAGAYGAYLFVAEEGLDCDTSAVLRMRQEYLTGATAEHEGERLVDLLISQIGEGFGGSVVSEM
jgi:hypothetical protein